MISNLEQFASRGLKAQISVDAILATLDPMLFSCLSDEEMRDHLGRTTSLSRPEIEGLIRERKRRAKATRRLEAGAPRQ